MKRKYYLRGLGTGILVTALILIIASGQKETMTDEEVKARARELGMVESTRAGKPDAGAGHARDNTGNHDGTCDRTGDHGGSNAGACGRTGDHGRAHTRAGYGAGNHGRTHTGTDSGAGARNRPGNGTGIHSDHDTIRGELGFRQQGT